MIRLDLSGREVDDYLADLAASHEFRVRVTLLDGDESELTSLTATANSVTSGSVQFDATQGPDGVSRRLELTFLDPEGKIRLEAGSPAPQGMFINHFVAVRREDYAPTVGRWVSCPVFYGVLTSFKRQGAEVTIEAMGKESKLLDPYAAKQSYVRHKGDGVYDIIHDIAHAQGERHFSGLLSGNPARSKGPSIGHTFTIPKWGTAVWSHLYKLAEAHNMHLMYDGQGRLSLRRRRTPNDDPFVFTGDFVTADTLPSVAFDFTQFRNTVVVHGQNPDGPKKAPHFTAVVDDSDPLSPRRLAWNGVPQFLVDVLENSHIKRISKARILAKNELDRIANVANDVEFSSLPVPVLEEWDVARLKVTVDNVEYDAAFNMKQWTLPLSTDGAMTVGSLHAKKFGRHHKRHRSSGNPGMNLGMP